MPFDPPPAADEVTDAQALPPGVPAPGHSGEGLADAEQLQIEIARAVHAADNARTHTERTRATAEAVEKVEQLLGVEPRLGRMLAFQALATQLHALGDKQAVKLAAQRPGYRRAAAEIFVSLDVRPWQPLGIMQSWIEGDDPVRHQVAVELADIAGTFELWPAPVSRSKFGRSGIMMLIRERFEDGRAPEPLVERMFETSSIAALSELRHGVLGSTPEFSAEGYALELSEAVIEGGRAADRTDEARLAEAKVEMAKLAGSERWWVRLFVVYTMAGTRSLWDEPVAVALLNDDDPFVARIARERLATVHWATGEARAEGGGGGQK